MLVIMFFISLSIQYLEKPIPHFSLPSPHALFTLWVFFVFFKSFHTLQKVHVSTMGWNRKPVMSGVTRNWFVNAGARTYVCINIAFVFSWTWSLPNQNAATDGPSTVWMITERSDHRKRLLRAFCILWLAQFIELFFVNPKLRTSTFLRLK